MSCNGAEMGWSLRFVDWGWGEGNVVLRWWVGSDRSGCFSFSWFLAHGAFFFFLLVFTVRVYQVGRFIGFASVGLMDGWTVDGQRCQPQRRRYCLLLGLRIALFWLLF